MPDCCQAQKISEAFMIGMGSPRGPSNIPTNTQKLVFLILYEFTRKKGWCIALLQVLLQHLIGLLCTVCIHKEKIGS